MQQQDTRRDAAGFTATALPQGRRVRLTLAASTLVLALATGFSGLAWAAEPAPTPANKAAVAKAAENEVSEVVVNGIPFKETVLPTRRYRRT